ncbi:hypothetical protein [Kitasatospora cheerisanensis]|uniref:Uncharacterized protein n=1 Tax=Kitasatospora cheerisanensis KCTC 2395 TaxID=1348663 RepID=A0A066Z2Q3_9ACTN|nr:hypothetical protein [Kitasatospora cheerisanensis]KDN88058.1 hypothetical protein KCH_01350 [Kitasatospora cheerisanensis KCTC 2395]
MTNDSAVALAVALRDAHFGLKALARDWAQSAPPGSVRSREALGPTWQYGDLPDRAAYLDGQALELAGGLTLTVRLAVDFAAGGTDLLAAVTVEDEEGNLAELLSTGPEEFPAGAAELADGIGRCLARLNELDLPAALR